MTYIDRWWKFYKAITRDAGTLINIPSGYIANISRGKQNKIYFISKWFFKMSSNINEINKFLLLGIDGCILGIGSGIRCFENK